MSLALDLLRHQERDVVLEYFELCRKFGETDSGNLDDWAKMSERSRYQTSAPSSFTKMPLNSAAAEVAEFECLR